MKPSVDISPLALNTKERGQTFAGNVLANWTKSAEKVFKRFAVKSQFHKILFEARDSIWSETPLQSFLLTHKYEENERRQNFATC